MMIKKTVLIAAIFFVSQNLFAEGKYPRDVAQFVEKRDLCEHFSGEISGEEEIDTARNLNEQLDKYCRGTDHYLTTLKLKYKDNKSILKKLNSYELIECTNNCINNSE